MSEPTPGHDPDQLWNEIRTFRRERYIGFESLMRFHVHRILLVASVYDSFTLEEAGRLTELVLTEYRDLNLSQAPVLTRATSGVEALALIEENDYDLVIAMTRIGDMQAETFARRAKALKPELPVIALVYNLRELEHAFPDPVASFDRVFAWSGDVRLLVAIIKLIEDLRNVEADTRAAGVRTILLVEDSVRFYSAYLPLLYTELVGQTLGLMQEGINLSQKLLRLRARPKILFATSFEEAWELYDRHREYMLGTICDASFPWKNGDPARAGLELVRRLKADDPQHPAVLQSTELENQERARAIGAAFIHKDSPRLLASLRKFLRRYFGFGDFVFRFEDGTEVGRARNLHELIQCVETVPDASLAFHAGHDHFSNWLRARTMFTLANSIKPIKATQFESVAHLRRTLLRAIRSYREQALRGTITHFSPETFDVRSGFTRIGTGSLGGKARGLGFLHHIINHYEIANRFPGVTIKVPPTAVVATDAFDAFLDQADLRELAIRSEDDRAVTQAFLDAELPPDTMAALRHVIELMRVPLAVRSSSLLEDAQYQPFAGVYDTFMLPNNHPDPEVRLGHLCDAIKLVYASVFSRAAKSYLAATSNRVEEEKMAVIIQQVVGRRYGRYVYPNFAGVAQSTDHYAHGDLRPDDGVALVALGLGRTVVEGGRSLRFSPAAPQRLWQFATLKDTLKNSQRRFLALDVSDSDAYPASREKDRVVWLDLEQAERDGTLAPVGSTYSPEDDAIYDGIHRRGPRLVSFAHVLKSGIFPLADVLAFLLDLGRRCLSCPIEIEFAANLPHKALGGEFTLLQIRPLASDRLPAEVDLDRLARESTLVQTGLALGNGHYQEIRDVVFVDRHRFERGKTPAIAAEVSAMNRRLRAEQRPYLLVGPGRWGSSDRWLGIPVEWTDISGAAVIVESDLDDFKVTPSQGTHFFQNLTSFEIGYLTVNQESGGGYLDWSWLEAQPVDERSDHLNRLKLGAPIHVLIDGRTGRGAVLKPGVDPAAAGGRGAG